MTNIILLSWDEKLTGNFDPNENTIVFRGGRYGEHALHVESGADAERVLAHFDGYCSNNETHPNYRGWKREGVIDRLASCIRNIKGDDEDAVHRT